MKKIAWALLALAVVLAGDFYFQSRSRPIARPEGVTPPATASEYTYSDALPAVAQTYYRPVVEEYLKQLPPHAAVIDLGCGNGSFLANFRGRGWKLVGLDISKSGIEVARTHWPDIRFEVADATRDLSAFGYGSFDAVISTEVIEHIFLPSRYAANCFKLLKPGGILVISTPYHGYLKNLGIALLNRFDRHWEARSDYGHIKFWSVETLSRLLFEAGFEQLEWRGAGRVPHLWKSMVIRARAPQRGPF